MELESAVAWSQESTTSPYAEPGQFSAVSV